MNANRINEQFKAIGFKEHKSKENIILKNDDVMIIVNLITQELKVIGMLKLYEFYIIADKLKLIEEDYFDEKI